MGGRGAQRQNSRETFWRGHIERQRRSGQSVRGYCRQHGLQESAFYWWRREVARRTAAGPATSAAAVVPVTVVEAPPAATLAPAAPEGDSERRGTMEIVLSSGGRIRVTGWVARAALTEVLAAVEGRPC